MAIVLMYTDPHLGLQRKSNFTAASSQARDDEAFDALRRFLIVNDNKVRFCLGDFFDTYSNKESVIARSVPIMEQTDLILAGNHDVANRVGVISSLQLLEELPRNTVVRYPLEEPSVFWRAEGLTDFFCIPHVINQETFEAMLLKAKQEADQSQKYRVLLLHCNYGLSEDRAASSLNLTRERAAELLGTFHYIFIGHEHTPREDFDGRLVLIGSWRPTAFDNIDDKRIVLYDVDTGSYQFQTVWSAAEHAYSGPASKAPLAPVRQYYTLEDDRSSGETQRLAVRLFEQGAFGVKVLGSIEAAKDSLNEPVTGIESLPSTIMRDLQDNKPKLVPYWVELSKKAAGAGEC